MLANVTKLSLTQLAMVIKMRPYVSCVTAVLKFGHLHWKIQVESRLKIPTEKLLHAAQVELAASACCPVCKQILSMRNQA